MYVNMCIYIYIYIHTYIYVCVCVCVHVCFRVDPGPTCRRPTFFPHSSHPSPFHSSHPSSFHSK